MIEKLRFVRIWVVLSIFVVLLEFLIEMNMVFLFGRIMFVFICVFRNVCVKLWF